MDDIIHNTEYKIEIEFHKRWFKEVKKYCLYKIEDKEVWGDESYGNGGGCFSPRKNIKTLIKKCDTFMEADGLKTEIEKLWKN